jgi:hypothetical protein
MKRISEVEKAHNSVTPVASALFIVGLMISLAGMIIVGWVIFSFSLVDYVLISTGSVMIILGFGLAWLSGSKGEEEEKEGNRWKRLD